MSQENVEIVRRALAAWNSRDIPGALALLDPEGEYINAPTAVEPGTRRGHDEIVGVFRKQWEIMPDAEVEIDQLHDRGDEVISLTRMSRAMPGSDARINTPALTSWRIRDGKVTRVEQLGVGPDFARALEAAGLSE